MEEEDWEHDEESGEEEGGNQDEINEDVLEDQNWNEENFREDVPEETTVAVEETVVQQETTWESPPQEELEQPPDDGEEPLAADSYIYRKSKYPLGGYGKVAVETNDVLYVPKAYGEVITTNVGFGQWLPRMMRESWGAAKPGGRAQLRSPINKVRFTQTGTPYCSTNEECMQQCREIQKYYMDLGFPDIPYNFLIGGDGVLYHGRGFLKQADRSPTFHRLKKICLDVAYIGDFIEKKVPYEMLCTAADFLKFGVKVSRITPFFQSFTFLGETKRS